MIYLASPYSHPDEHIRHRRFKEACITTAKFMRRGVLVFSPIVHGHSLAPYGLPMDWNYWEPMARSILQQCQEMYVLKIPGWQESRGVQAEVKLARWFGKRVSFIEAAITTDGL